MVKVARLSVLVLALLGLAVTGVLGAGTGTSTVTVTADPIDTFDVPAAVPLTFPGNGLTNYTQATLTNSGGLVYTQNSGADRIITVKCTTDPAPDNQNITLKLTASGGGAQRTLVAAGVPDDSDQAITGNLGQGTTTKDLSWTADATVAGTQAGSYEFVIEFTSAAGT